MSTTSKLRRRARQRSELTGESHQKAVRELTELGTDAPLVPDAGSPAQEQLEWWLLHKTAWPTEPVDAPFGFQWVTPRRNGLELFLSGDDRYLRWFAATVLPTVKDGGVQGIPGLRVVPDRAGAPLLRLAGTSAQVRLRGVTAARWRKSTDAARRDFAEAGHHPLWTAPVETMAGPEAELAPFFEQSSAGNRTFRLASGMLRRIGLFSAAGATACLTGWTTFGTLAEGWTFDFEFIPGHHPDHDRLLRLITDPDSGLPLTIAGRSCTKCPGPEASCRVELAATDGSPGRVTLLFRATEDEVIRAWEQRWPAEFARIRASWSPDGVPVR